VDALVADKAYIGVWLHFTVLIYYSLVCISSRMTPVPEHFAPVDERNPPI